jgi:hypothetical protein
VGGYKHGNKKTERGSEEKYQEGRCGCEAAADA